MCLYGFFFKDSIDFGTGAYVILSEGNSTGKIFKCC